MHQILRIISTLVIGTLVAKHLGPSQYGILNYVIAFTIFFQSISKLGLDDLIVKELVNKPNEYLAYLGTSFWLKITGSLISIGLLYITLILTSISWPTNFYILILAMGMFFQSFDVVESYFKSKVLAKITSICKIIQLAFSSIIKIYLILFEAELYMFLLVMLFDALCLSVTYFIAYRINRNLIFFRFFDFSIAKELLKYSSPLMFAGILAQIYMHIDQIIIKEILDENNLGIYSAAVRLSGAFYFIPVLISSSLFPAIISAKRQNELIYKNRVQNLYTLMIWTSIPLILLISLFSDWIINILFGSEYLDAIPILIIHIWSYIFVCLGVVSTNWFISENLQKYQLINTGIGAVLNILLNIVFLKNYGLIGAAYSTVISYGIASYLLNIIWKPTRPHFLTQSKSFINFNIFNEINIQKIFIKKKY